MLEEAGSVFALVAAAFLCQYRDEQLSAFVWVVDSRSSPQNLHKHASTRFRCSSRIVEAED